MRAFVVWERSLRGPRPTIHWDEVRKNRDLPNAILQANEVSPSDAAHLYGLARDIEANGTLSDYNSIIELAAAMYPYREAADT